ncbi:MAG: hypothetical protein V1736_08450 [Pseudomonadota bacterium]
MDFGNPIISRIYNCSPVLFQNLAVSFYGLKKRQRYGAYFRRYLEFLYQSQWFDKEKLQELQNAKLRGLIDYAYENVSYYRQLFDKERLKPADVRTARELVRIPILERETVRKHWKELLSKTFPHNQMVVHKSSGTSGRPVKVYVSRDCVEREYAYWWLHFSWAGIPFGAKTATCAGHPVVPVDQQKPPFWRYNVAENQIIFSSRHLSTGNLPFYAEAIRKFNSVMMHGYPSSIYLIARYLLREKIKGIRPRAVFTSSETLMDFQREAISEAFGCKVFSLYGNAERVVHANECEMGGMHIQPVHGVMEFLNEAGQPVAEGEEGFVVATGFDNRAMPLIRYRVGDMGVPVSGACKCGRSHPLIDRVVGRIENYIITPDGKYQGRLVGGLDYIFQDHRNVIEAQLIQEELDLVRIRIARDQGFTNGDAQQIISTLRARLGTSMRFRVEYVPLISDGKSKFKFVINKLKYDPFAGGSENGP